MTRSLGKLEMKALKVCNFASRYVRNKNECARCLTGSEYAFPLRVNGDRCENCEKFKMGLLEIEDAEERERFRYLCNNAEILEPGSSSSYKNFFEIGTDIPGMDFKESIEIDGVTVGLPNDKIGPKADM